MGTVIIYMTGKAWESDAGKEIKRILDRCNFHNYMTECGPEGVLKERTLVGYKQKPDWLRELDLFFLSLDAAKGESYEMLTMWNDGEGRWQRTTNRPRDLAPILSVRSVFLYKGKSPEDFGNDYEDRR